MDYLRYWSLPRKPFVDPDNYFFAGRPQREAIARFNDFLTSRLKSAFLIAPPGCGMTRLMRHVSSMSGFGTCATHVVVSSGEHVRPGDVQSALATALSGQATLDCINEVIESCIRSSGDHGVQTVWFADRCSRAAVDVARELAAMYPQISVVMGVRPQQSRELSVAFARCGMHIGLTPLQLGDTLAYLRQCMLHAGQSKQIFTDNAAIRIHELTGGVLAGASLLAELALSIAATHGMHCVDPSVIEAAAETTRRAG